MKRITIALLVGLACAHSTVTFAGLYGTIDSVDTLKTVAEQRANNDDRKIASDQKPAPESTGAATANDSEKQ